ncbi:MAG: hypothetical protein ACRDAM_05520, partial [Casimicrobium sp.]
ALFLGKTTNENAPESGEPSFDLSTLSFDCCEREDYYGNNPNNPNGEALRKAAREARAKRKEQA